LGAAIRRRALLRIAAVLQELCVENLLLIERAQLRLAPGLNVITGETGAGKSVLAHALDLLLGGRARGGIVRPGTAEAYVEGSFDCSPELRSHLDERLLADGAEVVLARRVGADGRTRAYVNGRHATLAELRELASGLICFYGQHEHRRLTISAAQLELLDEVSGSEQCARARACAEAYGRCGELEARLEELQALSRDRDRELELLDYELGEIELAAVDEAEHAQLLSSRERLRRLDALCAAAGAAAEALAGEASEAPGAVAQLAGAGEALEALAGVDSSLDGLAARVRALAIEAHEVSGELRDYHEGLAGAASGEEAGEVALEAIEGRLELIERLLRKHGGGVGALAEYAERARSRKQELEGAEVELEQTRRLLERSRAELDEHARALRSARKAAAPRLGRAVREQLASLAMADASFEVLLKEREPGPTGSDTVEFVISPNPGVPAGPVREIASGGELSRIMLALNTAGLRAAAGSGAARRRRAGRAGRGGAATATSTLAFDELDAGIGGHTARAVGARLRELAQHRQLLCITHLPQIASLGERHFSIAKDTSASPTRASVLELGEREVVSELVRMLGAHSGDSAARRHAQELRRAA
jgi:DNA repair protein RecN (Recombination protein N)